MHLLKSEHMISIPQTTKSRKSSVDTATDYGLDSWVGFPEGPSDVSLLHSISRVTGPTQAPTQ